MSSYVAIRFKGIIKKEFRDIFEPIALYGKWNESEDAIFKEFGENHPTINCIPLAKTKMLEKWNNDPWETKYNKETGEWIFQVEVNINRIPLFEFEDKIATYCIEKIDHYECWYELWNNKKEITSLERYENGIWELIGWFDEKSQLQINGKY